MISKGSFSSWPETKLMVGFCSTFVSCLLLLVLLHLSTFDGNPEIPCGEDCKQNSGSSASTVETARACEEDNVKAMVAEAMANPSNGLSQSETSQSDTPSASQPDLKVIQEWQLPAITNDRPEEKLDDPGRYGEPRRLKPMGSGAFLFILFGAYRGGSNTFAVVGLGPKGLHVYGNPGFECSWVSKSDESTPIQGNATKYYPDWGFGKQYTVVVVNCTFETDVGVDGSGGRLEFVANHGSWDQTGLADVQFVPLTEEPNEYDGSKFRPPYKYEYLYCGSPLFGSVSPQRMREWIAYHVRLFGPRSHFILYDAGGIHDDVRKVLEPWIKLGYITMMNFRQESRYDVYYYSQFLVTNDCIFQAKTLANWTFFFDVDEYIYIPDYFQFDEVMWLYTDMGRRAQQVLFKQNLMNHNHCRDDFPTSKSLRRHWGFEKLVYRCMEDSEEITGFWNRKYAVQSQYALDAGVHFSFDTLLPDGTDFQETLVYEDWRMTYYHYHDTINHREEICEVFVDAALNETRILNAMHIVDTAMVTLGDAVREFEYRTIGPQPFWV